MLYTVVDLVVLFHDVGEAIMEQDCDNTTFKITSDSIF
jgi:hypothetical protein